MIEQTKKNYSDGYDAFKVTCNGLDCMETETFVDMDWQKMTAKAKKKGWLIRKEDGDWVHYCPNCAADIKREETQ